MSQVNPFVSIEHAPIAVVSEPARRVVVEVRWGTASLGTKVLPAGESFVLGPRCSIATAIESELSVLTWRDSHLGRLTPHLATPSGERVVGEDDEVSAQFGDYEVVVRGLSERDSLFATSVVGVLAGAGLAQVGVSAAVHAGVVGSLAFFMPAMGADDAEANDRDQLLFMQKMLNASAERADVEKENLAHESSGESGGEAAKRHEGAEGKMGSTTAKSGAGRFGKQGPKDNPNPQLSRTEEREMARDFGFAGLLATRSGDHAPTSKWGEDFAQGKDSQSAIGNMFGDTIGDAPGMGGLGMLGSEEGGGGDGKGIGIADHGGLMGNGILGKCATGDCAGGYGANDRGKGHMKHVARGPSARPAGPTTVNGRLPSEVIQRIVRQNFGRFTQCYQMGLRENPTLSGRVAVRFMIGRDGAVSLAQDAGSDMPNAAVKACVVRAFSGLSFPSPEDGTVSVTYPIMFTPGE
jgi:hypothetical protein